MSRISENTVDAKKQTGKNNSVTFINRFGKGKRILFVGNSITRHRVKPEIGWNAEWGMAASCEEKDYVHQVVKAVRTTDPDAAFCIAQVAEWERTYPKSPENVTLYEEAREFGADVIIMRCVENCPRDDKAMECFSENYLKLIDYLNAGNGKVILTTSFWKIPADELIQKVGEQRGYPCIYLGDLGDDESMMAIGLFEHHGVAIHPGDKGMKTIAERILTVMNEL